MAKTARRQLGGQHLLFGEYLPSWTNLNVQSGLSLRAGDRGFSPATFVGK